MACEIGGTQHVRFCRIIHSSQLIWAAWDSEGAFCTDSYHTFAAQIEHLVITKSLSTNMNTQKLVSHMLLTGDLILSRLTNSLEVLAAFYGFYLLKSYVVILYSHYTRHNYKTVSIRSQLSLERYMKDNSSAFSEYVIITSIGRCCISRLVKQKLYQSELKLSLRTCVRVRSQNPLLLAIVIQLHADISIFRFQSSRRTRIKSAPVTADGVRSLLILGVIFHAIYVLSIFDIYFKSPVVHDIPVVHYTDKILSSNGIQAPAKRIVIFVADGCRADKVFQHNVQDGKNGTRIPFLRDIIQFNGSWGISHTRVPTESRPGHVALFAGMYEDVSAVTKGWQDNPVEFDSIFNHSRQSWLLGSPDIVPMFTRHIPWTHSFTYGSGAEDFAANNASALDEWVYTNLNEIFSNASSDKNLMDKLHSSQVIFFCHYLGIDTNGHAHRPQSRDYLENIAIVDQLVQKTVHLMDEFYGHDDQTAYVFTADHGMSNKGAHGDGDPANTRTPLIVWGAGIAKPSHVENGDRTEFVMDVPSQSKDQIQAQLNAQKREEKDASTNWDLKGYARKDVMQADIAALASSLLGIPYPRNSIGVLPFSYLSRGRYRAKAVLSNAEQMYLHVLKKQHEKESHTLFVFKPHRHFKSVFPKSLEQVRQLWGENEYDKVEEISQDLIAVCLDALVYLQRYDWMFLLATIVLGYLGWMTILMLAFLIARDANVAMSFGVLQIMQDIASKSDGKKMDTALLFALILTSFYLALEHSPFTYYLYVSFPMLFWRYVWKLVSLHWNVIKLHCGYMTRSSILMLGAIFACLEMIVVGYHHRAVFGVVFALLAIRPPYYQSESDKAYTFWSRIWRVSCALIMIFPFLPSEYGDSLVLVHLGGVLLIVFLQLAKRFYEFESINILWILASLFTLQWTMMYLQGKSKPNPALTILNWMISFGPIATAFFKACHEKTASLTNQWFQIAGAFAPAYILLSISYEVIFYIALCLLCIAWIEMEEKSMRSHRHGEPISRTMECRRAFIFLLLVKIAFFGTGNVASMSSFEISSTYRFVTIFAPFLMGALLIFKILIPFVVVICALYVIVATKKAARYNSSVSSSLKTSGSISSAWNYFILVVLFSDVLALHFLFLVRNEGSWKEIGNSISHFGIVNAQIVFFPLLFFVALF
uniref:GPI ethanolamine phosphate transferase 1 n=1 Tax=Albugo laibachii Nc14 TaxID=890382 RepID=F0W7F5_9STRA|nr:GPI ethanolamine phosphate transferase putative [Albugo laibachii Nc14]|eukprot:CCA17056.1 GPI ethanolamine phosphate transferase putative [Albugo laibachii Nc14]